MKLSSNVHILHCLSLEYSVLSLSSYVLLHWFVKAVLCKIIAFRTFFLIGVPSFGLFEAMSAIEMMDPKMDAGMIGNQVNRKVLNFEQAIKVCVTCLFLSNCS